MKQIAIWKKPSSQHGGAKAKGKRKGPRPVNTKQPMHFTYKASRARGKWNMLKYERAIQEELNALAKKYGVRIYRFQNVGNHLHLLLQAKRREQLQNFLRCLPRAIAYLVTGTCRGNPIGKFWDHLVHSRVVHWGKDLRGMHRYGEKNEMEASGVPRAMVDDMIAMLSGKAESS
jgi:hypothetical protein